MDNLRAATTKVVEICDLVARNVPANTPPKPLCYPSTATVSNAAPLQSALVGHGASLSGPRRVGEMPLLRDREMLGGRRVAPTLWKHIAVELLSTPKLCKSD